MPRLNPFEVIETNEKIINTIEIVVVIRRADRKLIVFLKLNILDP